MFKFINKDIKTMPRDVLPLALLLTWNTYLLTVEQHRCCTFTTNIEHVQLFHVVFYC